MMYITQKLGQQISIQKQRNWQGMWLIILGIFLAFTFFTGPSAFAANYYVAKNGNNSNPGTEAQPWLTIQNAANRVVAGDVVNVKAGSYNERLVLKASGSAAGGYITFQNYPGTKPILDGSGLGNGDMVWAHNKSYVKFQGFHITNHTGGGIAFSGEASHLEIRNNEISNQTHVRANGHAILVAAFTWPGPVFNKMTDVIVDNNYIHDVQTGFNHAYNEALTLSWNISRFQITNNVLERVSHIGIDCIGYVSGFGGRVPPGGAFPHNGIIAHNEVSYSGNDGSHTGIYLDGAKNVVIEYNKTHHQAGHGIVTSSENPGFETGNIIVRHNESWNNLFNLTPGSTFHGKAKGIRAVHNVLYSSMTGRHNILLVKGDDIILKNNISMHGGNNNHISHWIGPEFNPILDSNLYYPANAPFQYKGKHYSNFASYQAATGQDASGKSHGPLFVNTGSADFHLQSNSPSIDAGQFLTTTTGGGSGTTVSVKDPLYFSDGFGVVQGDLVQIGSNNPVRIVAIDYTAKTIQVNESIAWAVGNGVSYPYTGSAPDMGVYEQGGVITSDITSPATPTGLRVLN